MTEAFFAYIIPTRAPSFERPEIPPGWTRPEFPGWGRPELPIAPPPGVTLPSWPGMGSGWRPEWWPSPGAGQLPWAPPSWWPGPGIGGGPVLPPTRPGWWPDWSAGQLPSWPGAGAGQLPSFPSRPEPPQVIPVPPNPPTVPPNKMLVLVWIPGSGWQWSVVDKPPETPAPH